MSENNHHKEHSHRITISHQQLSNAAALMLLCAFFIFLTGFFWGKKSASPQMKDELASFSFADTLYTVFSAVREQPLEDEKTRR